jgi:hypothetical protein
MPKTKIYNSILLLIFCTILGSRAIDSQPEAAKEVRAETATTSQSKRALARQVIGKIGISNKYNLYLDNALDIAIADGGSGRNSKFRVWLLQVLTREAGWAKIEDKYIARLEADFSESELKELLNLAKHPLMKKLLQAEMQSYADSSLERRKLMFKVWDDYQSGKINPPSEVLR